MASKKIELVSFELHNYCTRQDDSVDFTCDNMQCDGCADNKKYLLAVDGRGIDIVKLSADYIVRQYMVRNRFFIQLKPKQKRGWGWLAVLLLLFGLAFGVGYFCAVQYLLN